MCSQVSAVLGLRNPAANGKPGSEAKDKTVSATESEKGFIM
jgi:hypothetical protein